jgi:quercetin dioxygenase-like cupin family protein
MKYFRAEKYIDVRGVIFNGTPQEEAPVIRNVMYITGKKGSVRGNHYHKEDTHYCMVIAGNIKFQWIEPGDSRIHEMLLIEGDIVLSEVGEKHKFIFATDGAFVAMATKPRTPHDYEEDLVREDFHGE